MLLLFLEPRDSTRLNSLRKMVEKPLEVEEIIRILNEDFVREIEATMIYVRNAFIMNQCDPSRVTEDIAVDEMRHMWWLADLIVKRGGKPSMEHKELEFGGMT
jgi:bacterioferritin